MFPPAPTLQLHMILTTTHSSTRGLDASTALEFARALRIATDIGRNATIVSIYQAGESIYEVFDKVVLIYEGRMVYHGPARAARQYFIDMGYVPANRQTTADFLVSVTDPFGRTVRPGLERPPPHGAADFEAWYRASDVCRENRADMEAYRREHVDRRERGAAFRDSATAEHASHTRRRVRFWIFLCRWSLQG